MELTALRMPEPNGSNKSRDRRRRNFANYTNCSSLITGVPLTPELHQYSLKAQLAECIAPARSAAFLSKWNITKMSFVKISPKTASPAVVRAGVSASSPLPPPLPYVPPRVPVPASGAPRGSPRRRAQRERPAAERAPSRRPQRDTNFTILVRDRDSTCELRYKQILCTFWCL